MIHKVARAMSRAYDDPEFEDHAWEHVARRALEALREPTPEMLRSVDDEAEDPMVARGRAYSAWQAMINTALGNEE